MDIKCKLACVILVSAVLSFCFMFIVHKNTKGTGISADTAADSVYEENTYENVIRNEDLDNDVNVKEEHAKFVIEKGDTLKNDIQQQEDNEIVKHDAAKPNGIYGEEEHLDENENDKGVIHKKDGEAENGEHDNANDDDNNEQGDEEDAIIDPADVLHGADKYLQHENNGIEQEVDDDGEQGEGDEEDGEDPEAIEEEEDLDEDDGEDHDQQEEHENGDGVDNDMAEGKGDNDTKDGILKDVGDQINENVKEMGMGRDNDVARVRNVDVHANERLQVAAADGEGDPGLGANDDNDAKAGYDVDDGKDGFGNLGDVNGNDEEDIPDDVDYNEQDDKLVHSGL